jgi:diguanylate cyclase (GGDEF)-like protein
MDKKRILVVEDERIVSEDIKMTLWSLGYSVEDAVSSGEEAIKKAAEVNPDLVLMDIRLEGKLGGIKAAQKIKKDFNIPVVYLTAYADENTLKNAKFTEPFGYLIKPFEDRELHATIEMAFYRYSMEKRLRDAKRKIELLHGTAGNLVTSDSEDNVYQETILASEEILNFSKCYIFKQEEDKLKLKSVSSQLKAEVDMMVNYDNKFFKELIEKSTLNMSSISGMNFKIPFLKGFRSILCMGFGEDNFFLVASKEENSFTEEDQHLLGLLLGHSAESLKRIQLQDELRIQAIHDPLTRVYNRFYLYQSLAREIKLSRRHKHSIAFIMIDVNNLKFINDKFGHHAGDKVLKIIAGVLEKEAREVDIVVRYGGDEFLIMLPDTEKEVELVQERILTSMKTWNEENDKTFSFPVSFAIGSAFWSDSGTETVDEVLAKADIRMYEHKRKNVQRIRG